MELYNLPLETVAIAGFLGEKDRQGCRPPAGAPASRRTRERSMMLKTGFAAGLLLLSFSLGCQGKCDALQDTCNLCREPDLKQECTTVVNAGNSDMCLSENRTLSGLCR
jgi:hypothetical protein